MSKTSGQYDLEMSITLITLILLILQTIVAAKML